MSKLNRVFIIGNITRNPDLKDLPNGQVCSFGVAINEDYTGKDGQKHKSACFVEVEMFGKRAPVIEKYFSKGDPIFIEGKLKLNQWESQSGERRSILKVIALDFQFINGRKDKEGEEQKTYTNVKPGDADINPEDIPF